MCKEIRDFEDLPKIIAVDFDGTLVEDAWPNIGKIKRHTFELMRYLRQMKGVKLILWTSRNYSDKYGDLLEEAVQFCKDNGLEFDAINENIPEVIELTGEDTRKVYADLYIDDKAVHETQSPVYWCNKVGVSWKELLGYIPPAY